MEALREELSGSAADLEGMLSSASAAIGGVIRDFQQQESLYDQVMGFASAVDWTEPLLLGIAAFHLLTVAAAVATRKSELGQCLLFVGCLVGVRAAEALNSLGAAHWEKLATQMYFDKYGVFTSVVWSGPLFLLAVGILVNLLWSVCRLLVDVKRAELKHNARARAKAEGTTGPSGGGASRKGTKKDR